MEIRPSRWSGANGVAHSLVVGRSRAVSLRLQSGCRTRMPWLWDDPGILSSVSRRMEDCHRVQLAMLDCVPDSCLCRMEENTVESNRFNDPRVYPRKWAIRSATTRLAHPSRRSSQEQPRASFRRAREATVMPRHCPRTAPFFCRIYAKSCCIYARCCDRIIPQLGTVARIGIAASASHERQS